MTEGNMANEAEEIRVLREKVLALEKENQSLKVKSRVGRKEIPTVRKQKLSQMKGPRGCSKMSYSSSRYCRFQTFIIFNSVFVTFRPYNLLNDK